MLWTWPEFHRPWVTWKWSDTWKSEFEIKNRCIFNSSSAYSFSDITIYYINLMDPLLSMNRFWHLRFQHFKFRVFTWVNSIFKLNSIYSYISFQISQASWPDLMTSDLSVIPQHLIASQFSVLTFWRYTQETLIDYIRNTTITYKLSFNWTLCKVQCKSCFDTFYYSLAKQRSDYHYSEWKQMAMSQFTQSSLFSKNCKNIAWLAVTPFDLSISLVKCIFRRRKDKHIFFK